MIYGKFCFFFCGGLLQNKNKTSYTYIYRTYRERYVDLSGIAAKITAVANRSIFLGAIFTFRLNNFNGGCVFFYLLFIFYNRFVQILFKKMTAKFIIIITLITT